MGRVYRDQEPHSVVYYQEKDRIKIKRRSFERHSNLPLEGTEKKSPLVSD